MPYGLPDYVVLQKFVQHLKDFFEQKRRYNPLPYPQLREQVQSLKTEYTALSAQIHASTTAKVAEVLLSSPKRLKQIACIQRLLKDLSPDGIIPGSDSHTAYTAQRISQSHATILGSVLFRYLRLEKEYETAIVPGAGFFEKAKALASAAISMVVDRSPKTNCALYNILRDIIFYPEHKQLDSLTIKNCLEAYHHYITHLPIERLAHYADIVDYSHGGKEGYLRNIEAMIELYQGGALLLEKELMYIAWIGSIAQCLLRWDQIWSDCIKTNKEQIAALTLETLSVWLDEHIEDLNLRSYFDRIIANKFFAKQVDSQGMIHALSALFEMNQHFTLLGACHFSCQAVESSHSGESHEAFLALFMLIRPSGVDKTVAETCDAYLQDCKYSYQALEQFFNLPDIAEVFPKDSLSYWGGVSLLKENIVRCRQTLVDAAEMDFVIVSPFTA